ncbi:MAG: hypothetical protein ACREQW_20590 [Candidatus Binatia bacterium]
MELPAEQAKSKVRNWAQKHAHAVLYDEENSTLLDVSSGKSLLLSWRDVAAFEEKVHPETGDSYLVLMFDSGVQIALVDPGGIAFAPSEANTGALRAGPSVVCLKDVYTLKGQIEHYLYQHIDEPPPRECLDMVMACIAILDGARAVGFEVGELEEELEKTLREIEQRIH